MQVPSPAAGAPPRRAEVLAVYGAGLFQGLSLVAVPAAATVLTNPSAYDLSESQYGLLFLPQVVMAIAASLALPWLAGRTALKHVLVVGLAANTLAMTLLVASNGVQGDATAFPMLLVATASLGLGFGLTLGSISTFAGAFHPEGRAVALTALNVLLGLGTALSPLLIALFLDIGEWWYLPVIAAAGLLAALVLAATQPLVAGRGRSEPGAADAPTTRPPIPALFWLFAATLVLYGIAETMFGNWGSTLLVGEGAASATSATYALAAFWAAVTVGRLVIALVAGHVRSTRIYVVLPWAMAVALVAAPWVGSAATGIALFAFAGLACSGFFPMTVGYGETSFSGMVELAAGWLIAAYQLGYGLAAFGGGALQDAVSLATLFRLAAVLAALMGLLALGVGRAQPSG